jgi:hypothetical protein
MSIQIQFTIAELKQAEDFCRKCLENRLEIEKLFKAGFFNYNTGLINIHKANKVIRRIDKFEEYKWSK